MTSPGLESQSGHPDFEESDHDPDHSPADACNNKTIGPSILI